MDKKVFIIFLIILSFLIPSAIAAYATFNHNAIKISDGKDVDLNGNSIGNGSIKINDTATFTIYTDGTKTYARNKNGLIYNDTNPAYVLDNVSNATIGGGTVIFQAGLYNFTTPASLVNGITYQGSGRGTNTNSTILNTTNGGIIFQTGWNGNSDNIVIKGFSFSGNNGYAIKQKNMVVYSQLEVTDNSFQAELNESLYCNCILTKVSDNWFGYYGVPGYNSRHIYFNGTPTQSANHNFIDHNRFYRANGSNSIYATTGYHIHVTRNDFELNKVTPIWFDGMYATYVEDNWFETNTGTALINYTVNGTIDNYINLFKGNYANSGTGQVRWFGVYNAATINLEYNTFTGADLPYTNDDTKISWVKQNLYTQYTGLVKEKNPLVAKNAYTGNSAANRAIPHNLGIIPKAIKIVKRNAGVTYDIIQSGIIHYNAASPNARTVTPADATNFYVGNAGSYEETANLDTIEYDWVAYG